MFQLKNFRETCDVMALKGDAKFKERLTPCLKNDIRNLLNFHAGSRKVETLHLDGLLLSFLYGKLHKSYVS